MLLLRKIKASSLQMVLVVSVIILLLLFAFISLVYIQKRISVKHANFKESVYLNHQVFDYLKSNNIPFEKTGKVDFFTSNNQEVIVTKKQWGIFELFNVTSKINHESFHKKALMGYANRNRNALYLSNKFQPLIVVGNTMIKGNAVLPSRGVNSGNIAGVSYNKSKFVYGNISQSQATLPQIFNKEKVEKFLTTYTQDTIEYFDINTVDFLQNSFEKKTKVFQKNGIVELFQTTLRGNIIIESDSIIKVGNSATLEDIVLIAPTVEIAEGFKGSVQVFATKKIGISKNCNLNYPSSLVVFDEDEKGMIKMSESSNVKGIIGYFKRNSKKETYKPNVLLEKSSVLSGELYSMGNIELRGKVNGSVYANSFIVNQSGSVYMNHIYNGTIDLENLPMQYVGLYMRGGTKSVAKWVD